MNFYTILGINIDATDKQVLTAFRELAHIYHPDKNNGESEQYILIRQAYEVLSDDNKRKAYNKINNFEQRKVAPQKAPTSRKKQATKRSNPKPAPEQKSKREYEDDFLKQNVQSQNYTSESQLTYNEMELAEFKKLIQGKLFSAKKDLAYLKGLITRKDNIGREEDQSEYMDGGLSMEREQLSQMASRQTTYIDHLEKALIRIEDKTYGICSVSGKLIDKKRLRKVPHATVNL